MAQKGRGAVVSDASWCTGPRTAAVRTLTNNKQTNSRKWPPISPTKDHVRPWCNHICTSTAWGTDYYK
jgi:hypothetical protein